MDMKKRILKWLKVFLICYGALFCLRFAQLNFTGHRTIAATSLPYSLLMDEELTMYCKDHLKDITVPVQLVDLNGDGKKECIINTAPFGFYYNIIYHIDDNGVYKAASEHYTRESHLIFLPPLTIWGYPVIL